MGGWPAGLDLGGLVAGVALLPAGCWWPSGGGGNGKRFVRAVSRPSNCLGTVNRMMPASRAVLVRVRDGMKVSPEGIPQVGGPLRLVEKVLDAASVVRNTGLASSSAIERSSSEPWMGSSFSIIFLTLHGGVGVP